MSTDIQTVQQGQNLSDVYQIMSQAGVHHVPILNAKQLVGMVSFTDMMQLNFNLQGFDQSGFAEMIDQQYKITDIMSQDLTTLQDKQSIRDAVHLLADGGFHSLPVVDDQQQLIGMVTSTDLICYLKEQY
ncbi:CBS domain-containing protein [Marinicella meishanensis]|uniref:CBS domain-containing protein n=1 Tax=Marinicella meishanensis TaxID=2873263 RepID=UPI001CBEE4AB|nr:CBS domain-containing protein [Marinicella sp. NBU2979]